VLAARPFAKHEAQAWAQAHLKGLYMCPLTPFKEDFSLDEKGLRRNLQAFLEMGVDGLVVGGFFAEGWNMTLEEWKAYHRIVAEEVGNQVPLFTIILDYSAYQALERLRYVEELGYAGAEVMNPPVQLRTEEEIYAYFRFLAEGTNLALVLYRTPVSGKVYSHETVERLAEIPNIVGVKNGTLAWTDSIALRRKVAGRLVVSEPDEAVFLYDAGFFGGRLLYGELSLILYGKQRHLLRRYTDLVLSGNFAAARPLSEALEPVRQVYREILLERIARTASYVEAHPYLKAWFELLGLAAGPTRPPVKPRISEEERADLARRLEEVGVL